MSNGLFKKPTTFKKVAIYIIMALGVVALGFVARTAYVVIMNPAAAFQAPNEEAPRQVREAPEVTPKPAQELAAVQEPVVAATPEPVAEVEEPDPEAVLLSQADLDFLKDRVTILLVGADQSPERLDKRDDYRSDVLMLITMDFSAKKVDMLSIPRDSLARIYDTKGRWKINACFEHGGGIEKDSFLYARETISMLLGGVPVQYHMGVTMDGIKRVVDAMGGVDYDVDVEIRLNGRTLEKGQQHLDGQQVLDYCRARKGISTDLGRIDRQQRMLFTIFDQLKSRDQLVNLPNVMNSVKDDIYTNLNFEQIAALTVFASGIELSNIERHTLKGEYMNVYNASFFVLDQDYKCQIVKDIFGVTIKPDKDFDLKKVRKDAKSDSSEKALARARAFLDANEGSLSEQEQAALYDRMNRLQSALESEDPQSIDSAIMDIDGAISSSSGGQEQHGSGTETDLPPVNVTDNDMQPELPLIDPAPAPVPQNNGDLEFEPLF